MDKEYIDREYYCNNICRCPGTECDKTKCPIWIAPAADVVPVVHGEWEYYTHTMMACSICKRHVPRHKSEYCPHCGAKMDGGNE